MSARELVLKAISNMEGNQAATAPLISVGSGLGIEQTEVVLAEMLRSGAVIADWVDMPEPRQRHYRIVSGGDHTCYDGVADASANCQQCKADFDATPAGIVTQAIARIGAGEGLNAALADLLQVLADEMADEHAVEKEFPDHIASARWQVCEFYGSGTDHDRWTYALAVARAVLGLANPNTLEVVR